MVGPVKFRKRGSHKSPFFSFTIIIFLSIIVINKGYAQEVVIPGNSRYNDTSGGQITDLPTKVISSINEVYWYEEPQMGHICFPNGDSILNQKINIRLDNAGIEIHKGGEIKILPLGLIHSVSIASNVLVTNKYFNAGYDLPTGFYRILNEGRYSLVMHLTYKVQQQNYNPQFDVGNTKAKAYRESKFLILMPDFTVIDISDKSKKAFCNIFEDPQRSRRFIKENKLRLNKEEDLIKLVRYENHSSN